MIARACVAGIAAGLLASCGLKISHADGSVTHFGVVNLREGRAGELPLVHSRRLGVMLDAGANGNGIALGYDESLIVKPPNDAVTEVDYTTGSDPSVSIKRHTGFHSESNRKPPPPNHEIFPYSLVRGDRPERLHPAFATSRSQFADAKIVVARR